MANSIATILKKVNLGSPIENFENDKITPDLVCKLSVLELEILGVNSRSDMMTLRIECSKFGEQAPRKCQGSCGAPVFLIPKSVLQNLVEEGFTVREISTIMSVSESTIYRRMSSYGISKFDFTDISDQELDVHVEQVSK